MNNPFDRLVINLLEKQVSSDVNVAESEIDQAIRLVALQSLLGRNSSVDQTPGLPVTGFYGASLKVQPFSPASGQILVKEGLGFAYNVGDTPTNIGGVAGVNDLSPYKPFVLNADQTITIPAAPSSGTQARIDIIEVNYNRLLADSTSRLVFNAGSGVFAPNNVLKTLSFSMDGSVGIVASPAVSTTAIGYKTGVVAASAGVAVVPATSPGYTKIGQILINTSATTFDYDVIQDLRRLLAQYGTGMFSFSVSMPIAVSLVPTVSGVATPSGVNVVAVGTAFAGAACTVYIFGFDPSNGDTPILTCNASNTTSPPTTTVSLKTISSDEQTAIAGANSSTPTKVAVGQPCIKMDLLTTAPSSTVLYSNHVVQKVK